MTQPTQRLDLSLTANSISPKWDSLYPAGNRPSSILISRLDLSSGLPSTEGWGFGALNGGAISVASDEGGSYLRGQYPIPGAGDNYIYGGYDLPSLKSDIYVQLYARLPGVKQGCKFVKIFGSTQSAGSNYANITFGQDYASGMMDAASFGDGATVGNDTSAVLTFTDAEPWRTVGRSTSSTPPAVITKLGSNFNQSDWGTGWHKFQFRIKHNSGTSALDEVNDGVIEVRIDDTLYGRGINLFTRHYSNLGFSQVALFGWSQTGTQAFEVHMKDVTISEGGWID